MVDFLMLFAIFLLMLYLALDMRWDRRFKNESLNLLIWLTKWVFCALGVIILACLPKPEGSPLEAALTWMAEHAANMETKAEVQCFFAELMAGFVAYLAAFAFMQYYVFGKYIAGFVVACLYLFCERHKLA